MAAPPPDYGTPLQLSYGVGPHPHIMVLSAVLPAIDQATLLNAVPSFAPLWERWLTDQADYVSRFPEEALSPPEHTHEFLSRLADHLGYRIAADGVQEAGWLFAALEQVYERADNELAAKLTVGFLESLVHAIEFAGADARIVDQIPKGPACRHGWGAAYQYTHPPDEV